MPEPSCKHEDVTSLTAATSVSDEAWWTRAVDLVIVDDTLGWKLTRVALGTRVDTESVDTRAVGRAVRVCTASHNLHKTHMSLQVTAHEM